LTQSKRLISDHSGELTTAAGNLEEIQIASEPILEQNFMVVLANGL